MSDWIFFLFTAMYSMNTRVYQASYPMDTLALSSRLMYVKISCIWFVIAVMLSAHRSKFESGTDCYCCRCDLLWCSLESTAGSHGSYSATGWTTVVRYPERAGIFSSSPPRPDRRWGPPSIISNGYQR